MTRLAMGAALVGAGLLAASSAFAHAHLKTAYPAANSSVRAPAEVAIDFTEGLEPRFSAIEVQDKAGARVDSGEAHLAPSDSKHISIGLKPLPPGTYTVIWHTTSVDTHKTKGRYDFTVTP